jgi:hypothetical protein
MANGNGRRAKNSEKSFEEMASASADDWNRELVLNNLASHLQRGDKL